MSDTDHSYSSILSAAEGLLCESVQKAKEAELQFAVIGGWSPYYLSKGSIIHPGTRDVDLLFKDGETPDALRSIIEKLHQSGYLHSAKHDFQMLRVLNVENERFVFNVDLLHVAEIARNPSMFADHLTLPVRLSDFNEKRIVKRSIKVPTSNFIFDGFIKDHTVRAVLPDGNTCDITIPLMDEVATLVTKAESMQAAKRSRDVFDILLTITQASNFDSLISKATQLRKTHPAAFAELEKLWIIAKQSNKYRSNVEIYWPHALDDDEWNALLEKLKAFLNEIGTSHNR